MPKKIKNILWLDWWSHYIGLAYKNEDSNVIMPIGYLINDGMFFFNFADILTRYQITKIIIWYPNSEEKIQKKIDNFIWQLNMLVWDVEIVKQNEDYTTTQAGEITWNYRKNESQDTIAAMKILQDYINYN